MFDSNILQILVELKDLTSAGFDKLKMNVNSVGTGLDTAAKSGSKFGSVMQGVGLGIGMGAFQIATTALSALPNMLEASAKAYRDNQVSVAQLNASLVANVEGWSGTTTALEGYISQASAASAFTRDDLRQSLEKLVGATGDVAKAENLQTTATNLARYAHIDLATATTNVVKANEGVFTGLKKLGIVIPAHTSAMQALADVNALVAGQDQTYLTTEAGKLDTATNALEEQRVKLGQVSSGWDTFATNVQVDVMSVVNNVADAVSNATSGVDQRLAASAARIAAQEGPMYGAAGQALGQQFADRISNEFAMIPTAAGDAVEAAVPVVHKAILDLGGSLDADWNALFKQVPNPMIAVLQKDLNKPGLTSKQKKYIQDELKGLQKTVLGSAIDLSPMIIPDSKRESMLLASIATLEANRAAALKGVGGSPDIPTVEADSAALTKLITEYNALVNAETSNYGNGLKHMAAGGPVMAGVAYTIGERGSERFVPKTDGYILPHGAGGGQTVHMVQVFLDGKEIAANTAQHLGRQLSLVGGSRMYGSRL